MNEINDFLLNLFTGTDGDYRPHMMFPNLNNGFVSATDSHALIMIPENELSLKYSSNDKYPNIEKFVKDLESRELSKLTVNVGDIAKELTKARIEIDKNSIKCDECKGVGTVDFTYEDKEGTEHNIDGDCPTCEGSGGHEEDKHFARIRLGMIENEESNRIGIEVENLYFHPFHIYRLFMVAFFYRVNEFEIFYDPKNYGFSLSYFGNIKVLIALYKKP